MLVDIVSRNGNLLLNFPLPSSGMLDPEELKILDEITKWMAVNSEGIYGTRPWKISGHGPAMAATKSGPGGVSGHHSAQAFNERNRQPLSAEDVRFTTKGSTLYAFLMGWPQREALIEPLGRRAGAAKIANVELLGYGGKLQWSQQEEGLKVAMPAAKPCDHAITLKVIA